MTRQRNRRSSARRGNAMILVAGLLALLVIVATAYITRTTSGRDAAASVQSQSNRENAASIIAGSIAAEPAEALFVHPLVFSSGLGAVPDANTWRSAPDVFATSDADPVLARYGVDPTVPYNFAPYATIPATNWPDELAGAGVPLGWPKGEGAPASLFDFHEGNPLGWPGYGDARWLSDLEPLRWDFTGSGREPQTFRQWRHWSNFSRVDNGWRIIRDMADVTNEGGFGGLVTDLNVPVEQWLTAVMPIPVGDFTWSSTGGAIPSEGNPASFDRFLERWRRWLGGGGIAGGNHLASYGALYRDPNWIPPNLVDLSRLSFAGRTQLERYVTDVDGDGYTDSFWQLAPSMTADGARQAVAIRVVDNSAMLNANVATRFVAGAKPNSSAPDGFLYRTSGETPADLALLGGAFSTATDVAPTTFPAPPNWRVGFLDTFRNRGRYFDLIGGASFGGEAVNVYWVRDRWDDFLAEIGAGDRDAPLTGSAFDTVQERRHYWYYAGSRPFAAEVGYTPFTLADELELRMFHGNNYLWNLSRFERAMNTRNVAGSFLRSGLYNGADVSNAFNESSEFINQLDANQLVYDARHRLTLHNGARNDLLPPWLWWRWRPGPGDPGLPARIIDLAALYFPGDPGGQAIIRNRFLRDMRRKADLREGNPSQYLPDYDASLASAGRVKLYERLPWLVLNALSDGDGTGRATTAGGNLAAASYFGSYSSAGDSSIVDLRRAAASYTANLLARRDADLLYDGAGNFVTTANKAPVYDEFGLPIGAATQYDTGQAGAIPLPEWGRNHPLDWRTRFLGMEVQPFLVEAFIADCYEIEDAAVPPPFDTQGLKERTSHEASIAVVQLANPFDRDITWEELSKYAIRFLGNEIRILNVPSATDIALPAATENRPATVTFWQITGAEAWSSASISSLGFQLKWLDFLDLTLYERDGSDVDLTSQPPLHPLFPDGTPASRFHRVDFGIDPSDTHGTIAADHVVELVRYDDHPVLGPQGIVVDRFDPEDDPQKLVDYLEARSDPDEELAAPSAGVRRFIRANPGHNMIVQWARVARAWGADFNGIPGLQIDERAPRFICAEQLRTNIPTGNLDIVEIDFNAVPPVADFNAGTITQALRLAISDSVDPDPGQNLALTGGDPRPDDAWFTYAYPYPYTTSPDPNFRRERKPTFFDGNQRGWPATDPDPLSTSYPDRGFYGNPRLEVSFQMLQKDADFDQVGEALNVWLWGHELEFQANDPLAPYVATEKTFSEAMRDDARFGGPDREINRIRLFGPTGTTGLGVATSPVDVNHAVPVQPPGTRLLDLFVCDGPGFNYAPAFAGHFDFPHLFFRRNASAFSGEATPGLINLNTAPIEVLRAIPHWYKMVHWDASNSGSSAVNWDRHYRSMMPEAVVAYREKQNNDFFVAAPDIFWGIPNGPNYQDRFTGITGVGDGDIREERGLRSLGELMMLRKDAVADLGVPAQGDYFLPFEGWRYDYAALNPFANQTTGVLDVMGAHVSADVDNPPSDHPEVNVFTGDAVAADVEEANLLIAAASNLVTTRSDVFTVYFKVRTFRQDPVTGTWDATNPENILDESRYVMLLDRSAVERPGDPPRILSLERLPY